MSSRQLSCDLRVVGVDLGCAAIRVLVWGVAGVGSWLGRHRQDVAADRAQRILDAERLAEDEAEIDVWEDGSERLLQNPETLLSLLKADESQAVPVDLADTVKRNVTDLYVQCAFPMRPDAIAASDTCQRPATSAVEIGTAWYWRCDQHMGLIRPGVKGVSRIDVEVRADRVPVHPADAKHHGGHRLNLDGTVTPLTLSAQHLSAGGAVGPEAVSGQPPASGQPTAKELLDHIESLIKAHWLTWDDAPYDSACQADGCSWVGDSLDHPDHVFALIAALVAADVRVGDALKGTR